MKRSLITFKGVSHIVFIKDMDDHSLDGKDVEITGLLTATVTVAETQEKGKKPQVKCFKSINTAWNMKYYRMCNYLYFSLRIYS